MLAGVLLVALALAGAGCGSYPPTASTPAATTPSTTSTPSTSSKPGAGTIGPEGVKLEAGPLLAPASTTAPGTPVHGIQCAPLEQLAYHIHVHLLVYVDGQPRALPPAIGMIGRVAQQTANGPL